MESSPYICYIIYKGDDLMWSRKELKTSAKGFLRENYWKAFIVCLIVILLTTTHVTTGLSQEEYELYMEKEGLFFMATKTPIKFENRVFNYISAKTFSTPIIFIPSDFYLLLTISFILFNIFVGSVLKVGQAGFFLDGLKGDTNIKKLWSYFDYPEEYWNVVKVIFIRGLYTVLWSLLFLIPGIIKSYEYRMVPYILANNSGILANEAIQRSRKITDGHKWDIFVLDISFLGWDLLGYLLLGLGTYFVSPYREATYAKLYDTLDGFDEIDEELILE